MQHIMQSFNFTEFMSQYHTVSSIQHLFPMITTVSKTNNDLIYYCDHSNVKIDINVSYDNLIVTLMQFLRNNLSPNSRIGSVKQLNKFIVTTDNIQYCFQQINNTIVFNSTSIS